jgi:Fic-DOC domain mobile mystery protein B
VTDRQWDLHVTQYGETPIDEDVREFLTPKYEHIRTKDELNAAESSNIAIAISWLRDDPFPDHNAFLTQSALRDLHRRMFDEVWSWAGRLRQRQTNMGVDPTRIQEDFELLLGNTRYQIDHDTYPPAEIGVRLHRAMLAIHCFPNGNGRHARLGANELGRILGLGRTVYTWGRRSGGDREAIRREYLDALQLADRTDDYGPLVRIATS